MCLDSLPATHRRSRGLQVMPNGRAIGVSRALGDAGTVQDSNAETPSRMLSVCQGTPSTDN